MAQNGASSEWYYTNYKIGLLWVCRKVYVGHKHLIILYRLEGSANVIIIIGINCEWGVYFPLPSLSLRGTKQSHFVFAVAIKRLPRSVAIRSQWRRRDGEVLERKTDFLLFFCPSDVRRNHIIFLWIALCVSSFVGKTNWMLERQTGC